MALISLKLCELQLFEGTSLLISAKNQMQFPHLSSHFISSAGIVMSLKVKAGLLHYGVKWHINAFPSIDINIQILCC